MNAISLGEIILKFLIFANYLPHVINFRGKLLEALSDLAYEIHILAPNLAQHPEEFNNLSELGYHLHEIPLQRTGTDPLTDFKTLVATYRLLSKIQPDVILSYTIKSVIYGTLAAWFAKVPRRFVLISGLGYTFSEVDEKDTRTCLQKFIHGLYTKALTKADKVFFQNPDDLQLFRKLGILKPNISATVVNGSGVDISRFDVVPFPTHPSGEIKPSFLLVGRLLKDKGLIEYIEAAKIIKNRYPETEFHLVGYIDENPAAITQSQLDKWIDSGVINYWGKLKDVRPAIAASSVYVLPSYREGTSRSVLEAMAMGRPIITTDAPGCRETVDDSINGFLVPIKTVDELIEAMEKFVKQPQLIKTMGKASRQLTEEKYDVKKVNETMIKEMSL